MKKVKVDWSGIWFQIWSRFVILTPLVSYMIHKEIDEGLMFGAIGLILISILDGIRFVVIQTRLAELEESKDKEE